jgi:deoxyribonuclease (pyrimidine dimer)
MTRINCIDPKYLLDQHLMAEYREINMVSPALNRSKKAKPLSKLLQSIPKAYTLNKGHVTFFYDKAYYLEHRYQELTKELKNRNYNIDDERALNLDSFIEPELKKDWTPTPEAVQINIERIIIRFNQKPKFYTYNKIKIDNITDFYKSLL